MDAEGCFGCGCLLAIVAGIVLAFVLWGPVAGLIAILIAVVLMK